MHHPVEVSPEPSVPVALALHELHEPLLLQEVQMALDGSRTSGEALGERLHARPAEARSVVRVIGERAIGGDHLGRNPREHEVAHLRYKGKSGSHRHINLLEVLRRVRPGDVKIHQSGGFRAIGSCPAAFFYGLSTAVLYLQIEVRATLQDQCNSKAAGRIKVSTLSLGSGSFVLWPLLSVRLSKSTRFITAPLLHQKSNNPALTYSSIQPASAEYCASSGNR